MVRLHSPSRFIPDAPHGHAFSLNAHDNGLQPMPLEGGLEPAPADGLRRVVLHHFSSFSCRSVSSLPTNPHCCGTHNFVDKYRSTTVLSQELTAARNVGFRYKQKKIVDDICMRDEVTGSSILLLRAPLLDISAAREKLPMEFMRDPQSPLRDAMGGHFRCRPRRTRRKAHRVVIAVCNLGAEADSATNGSISPNQR